jgi:hypothetical protein
LGGWPCSLADASAVILQRFGRIVQLYVTGIMLVSMGTAMTVEYTTVGSLFSLVIPSTAIPIVVIIGVVSSVYTAYGGLHVSLITDQVQVRTSAPTPTQTPMSTLEVAVRGIKLRWIPSTTFFYPSILNPTWPREVRASDSFDRNCNDGYVESEGTENLPLIGFLPLKAVPLIEVRLEVPVRPP